MVVDVRDKRSIEQRTLPPQYDQAIPIPGNNILPAALLHTDKLLCMTANTSFV